VPRAAAALVGLVLAARVDAALVVLEEGRHLKVTAFELVGEERIRLSLLGGGELVLPIERVERIVDDEIDPKELQAPRTVAPAPSAPRLSVRARAGRSALAAPAQWASLVEAAAAAHRLDPAFVAAVIRVESNWQPRAVSPKGARGLMQLMPATARRLGVTKAFDPSQNVGGGALYLSRLAERFGEHEVEKVLAAYNAGEEAVETYKGVPPYRETREYVRKVLAHWTGTAASGS
jgi:soluble lytic murein transglycosylase-like protein